MLIAPAVIRMLAFDLRVMDLADPVVLMFAATVIAGAMAEIVPEAEIGPLMTMSFPVALELRLRFPVIANVESMV